MRNDSITYLDTTFKLAVMLTAAFAVIGILAVFGIISGGRTEGWALLVITPISGWTAWRVRERRDYVRSRD